MKKSLKLKALLLTGFAATAMVGTVTALNSNTTISTTTNGFEGFSQNAKLKVVMKSGSKVDPTFTGYSLADSLFKVTDRRNQEVGYNDLSRDFDRWGVKYVGNIDLDKGTFDITVGFLEEKLNANGKAKTFIFNGKETAEIKLTLNFDNINREDVWRPIYTMDASERTTDNIGEWLTIRNMTNFENHATKNSYDWDWADTNIVSDSSTTTKIIRLTIYWFDSHSGSYLMNTDANNESVIDDSGITARQGLSKHKVAFNVLVSK